MLTKCLKQTNKLEQDKNKEKDDAVKKAKDDIKKNHELEKQMLKHDLQNRCNITKLKDKNSSDLECKK